MGRLTAQMTRPRRFPVSPRQLLITSLLILVIVAIIGLVVISPLAMAGLGGLASDWGRLSLIGQTYGAASALLSVIALTGVGASLILQAKENRSNREQVLRTSHAELMRLAMDNPVYAEIWAPLNPPGDFDLQRQHMYPLTELKRVLPQVICVFGRDGVCCPACFKRRVRYAT